MESRIPASPQPWPETERFWEAANQGRFMLQRCCDTGKAFFYPRAHSPFTGRNHCEWFEASGRGTLYSFSVLPRAKPPYCIAYVELEEGPIILTNIVGADFDRLEIGQPVKVTFVDSENGQKVPMFSPAG
ncbi:Zn-ribbon domain-containing OB-fold protein [Marinobacterium lutimaris]|uniref:DUF35 domain-containing protein n=1 Tax=Marinobacterium lutimaris TaxID=568106 RepID=A0A1H6CPU9_9GAMM|nr:Zn-ribbon domain-containing OB-fold protein [Marinobacterium lutimaris]SEG75019.1 hypothetical protein SAMN05444390_1045 [Marinobacterium lutimaris]